MVAHEGAVVAHFGGGVGQVGANGASGLPDLDSAIVIGDANNLAEVIYRDSIAISREGGAGDVVPQDDIVLARVMDLDGDLAEIVQIDRRGREVENGELGDAVCDTLGGGRRG